MEAVVVAVVGSVLQQTAMATMTLVEHWRAATVLFLAGAAVGAAALLAAAGAVLAGALAMPQWRMATPPHLLWYAVPSQAQVTVIMVLYSFAS